MHLPTSIYWYNTYILINIHVYILIRYLHIDQYSTHIYRYTSSSERERCIIIQYIHIAKSTYLYILIQHIHIDQYSTHILIHLSFRERGVLSYNIYIYNTPSSYLYILIQYIHVDQYATYIYSYTSVSEREYILMNIQHIYIDTPLFQRERCIVIQYSYIYGSIYLLPTYIDTIYIYWSRFNAHI